MGDPWLQAAKWLASLNVISKDSPALRKDAGPITLVTLLQDGTILCNAVNVIAKNSIELIHQFPEKQFLKMQNILKFLDIMPKFGVTDLFTAEDLYYASNFQKVLRTLSLLSQTQMAGLAGFKYFSDEEVVKKKRGPDEEDLYSNLENLVAQQSCLKLQEKELLELDEDDDKQESMYQSIRNGIPVGSEDIYKALIPYEEGMYATTSTSHDAKRDCVLLELHETEKNYIGVLKIIIETFADKMRSQPKLIPPTECSIIFSNIDEILGSHIIFYENLTKQMANKTGRIISKVFFESLKSFQAYGQLCCEVPDAIAKIKELLTKPASAKLIEQLTEQSKQRFSLIDLLNVPMQRILKYPLLLKELVKNTPESHGDKKALNIALADVQRLAQFINDKKEDDDTLKKILQYIKDYPVIGKPLNEYGASGLKDGDLMCKTNDPKEKPKLRYVFLLQSAVIFCKTKGVFYHYKHTLELDIDLEIIDMPEYTESSDDKYLHAWQLRNKRTGEAFIFAAKNITMKKKWFHAMRTNLDNLVSTKDSGIKSKGSSNMYEHEQSTPAVTSRRSPEKTAPAPAPAPQEPKKTPTKSYETWVPLPVSATAASTASPFPQQNLSKDTWFAGKMARVKAEQIIQDLPDGTYLVRESERAPGEFTMTIKFGPIKHIIINNHNGKYDIAPDSKTFMTIFDLVAYYQQHSLERHFPLLKTTLALTFRDAKGDKGGIVRALFDYKSQHPDELSFEKGAEIVVITVKNQDEGWWKGKLSSGQTGIFPANYVQKFQ